jgi:hypothetical protein
MLAQPGVVAGDLAVPLQVFRPWPPYFAAEQPSLVDPYRAKQPPNHHVNERQHHRAIISTTRPALRTAQVSPTI